MACNPHANLAHGRPLPSRSRLLRHLHQGGVIAYATESCYGLGCDPRNTQAVHRMQHAGRSPKNVARAMLRWLISHLLAFAYHWDASALAPNVLVQMRKPSNQIHPTPTPTPTVDS